jgi:hypothetical protein
MIVVHEHHDGPLALGTDEHRRAWLPRLGPTAYLLAVELASYAPGTYDAAALARALGVGPARMVAALDRLRRGGHAERIGTSPQGEPVYTIALAVGHPRPTAA